MDNNTILLPKSLATTQNASGPCEQTAQKTMPKNSIQNDANPPSVAQVPCAERKPLVPICDTPVGLQEGILAPGTAVRHPLQASPAPVKPEPVQDDHGDLPDLVSHEQLSDAAVENFDLRPAERRGARDRKQRIMMIDGQVFLGPPHAYRCYWARVSPCTATRPRAILYFLICPCVFQMIASPCSR